MTSTIDLPMPPLPESVAGRSAIGVLDAIRERRSVRNFTARRLDKETIRTLLDAAVHAPTAVHEEPWQFAIVQNAEALRRISDRAKRLWLTELGQGTPAPRSTTTPPANVRSLADRLADPAFNIFYNAGTLVVIAGKPLGPFVAADCWLAAENLMLAAYALGLGTCCIGFALGALNAPETKAELEIPPASTVVAAIIVGEPAAAPLPVGRKLPEIVSWK